jgi:methyl coenzyme M reductase subunit D
LAISTSSPKIEKYVAPVQQLSDRAIVHSHSMPNEVQTSPFKPNNEVSPARKVISTKVLYNQMSPKDVERYLEA